MSMVASTVPLVRRCGVRKMGLHSLNSACSSHIEPFKSVEPPGGRRAHLFGDVVLISVKGDAQHRGVPWPLILFMIFPQFFRAQKVSNIYAQPRMYIILWYASSKVELIAGDSCVVYHMFAIDRTGLNRSETCKQIQREGLHRDEGVDESVPKMMESPSISVAVDLISTVGLA